MPADHPEKERRGKLTGWTSLTASLVVVGLECFAGFA
jgi:hypothetical protein